LFYFFETHGHVLKSFSLSLVSAFLIAEEMCDSSRILMSPRLGSEKDEEEEVHKNEFHYYFLSSSSFILDSYFGFFKLEETLVEGCYT